MSAVELLAIELSTIKVSTVEVSSVEIVGRILFSSTQENLGFDIGLVKGMRVESNRPCRRDVGRIRLTLSKG